MEIHLASGSNPLSLCLPFFDFGGPESRSELISELVVGPTSTRKELSDSYRPRGQFV